MAAGYQNILLEQGSSFSTTISLGNVTGSNFDLTNYTANSQIRKSYYSANISGSFTVTITDPVSGQIMLQMGASESANISAGRYVYDVKLTSISDPNNNTVRILEGIVEVSPQVTI